MQITTLETWRESAKVADLDNAKASRVVAKRKTALKGLRERNEGMNEY